MSKWDSKTNTHNENGIDWFENYGIHHSNFGIFSLTVEWTSDGYKVHIDGHATGKARPKDFNDAEKLCIDFLKMYVNKMTEVIETYESKQKTGQ